jgi:hypothetical protein
MNASQLAFVITHFFLLFECVCCFRFLYRFEKYFDFFPLHHFLLPHRRRVMRPARDSISWRKKKISQRRGFREIEI